MKTWKSALAAALMAAPLVAAAEGRAAYISDDVSVAVRTQPDNGAPTVGSLKSGAHLTVLESLGPDSFAHIRTEDGREGWITARFLSDQPAAREQLGALRQQLDQAHAQAQTLQSSLNTAQEQLARAKPALERADEFEKKRADLDQREQRLGELEQGYNREAAHRATLIAGAALVGAGVLLGLLLPWLGGNRRRRSSF
jgi:SH3 domain protein